MYYRKREDESYEVSEEKITEDFVEMSDDLFAQDDTGSTYLKTYLSSEEYQRELIRRANYNKMIECKQYLYETDYIVIKLSELKLDNLEEYETEKTRYTEILSKRKECRKFLNEIG